MKTALLILAFATAASSQMMIPCLVDTAPPGINGYRSPPNRPDIVIPAHLIRYGLRPEFQTIRDINAGTALIAVAIHMPVAGTCSGSFESRNNQDDSTKVAIDAAGRYTHIRPPRPGDDVEIFVVDIDGWNAFARDLNPELLGTTGRSPGGTFSFDLPQGTFYIVINNRYSAFASKQVKLWIGKPKDPEKGAP